MDTTKRLYGYEETRPLTPAQKRRLTKKARKEVLAYHKGKLGEDNAPGQDAYDWIGHDFEPPERRSARGPRADAVITDDPVIISIRPDTASPGWYAAGLGG